MHSIGLFDNLKKDDVCRDPFPHIILENVLSEDFANQLLNSIPVFESVSSKLRCTAYRFGDSGEPLEGSKFVLDRKSIHTFKNLQVWDSILKPLLGEEETKKLWNCFSDDIASLFPEIYEQFRSKEKWNCGLRGVDSFEKFDLLLDAEFVYHSPGKDVSQERGPHIKVRDKILECHYMMRHQEDFTEGGDLELYRFNENCFITYLPQQQIKNRNNLTLIKTIPFKHNQLVAWLNSPNTVMAYSARQPGRFPLHYMASVIQLPKPIFSLPSYVGSNPMHSKGD